MRRADGPVAGQSAITFDLAWDHSWRAAWKADTEQHGGKDMLMLESWDAAWVFVKVRNGSEGPWSHAMLATNRADHQVPAAAVLDVGMTDDPAGSGAGGRRGIGVFVYRKTAGSGPNVFKAVTLRWQHPAATGDAPFDAAKAELRVFAIQMVRVPECAFWVGDGFTNRVNGQFSTGGGTQPFRIESEQPLALGGDTPEILNNRDGVGMSEGFGDDFHSDIPRTIPAAFPKGYRAFYCMRHEITVRQYVDFLNTLSYAGQRERTEPQGKDRLGPEAPTGTVVMTR